MQKISLCLTIKNEETNIENLLNSISTQTILPDEVVIVDGGSTDKTLAIVDKLKNKFISPILLISLPNSTRSEGRNKAIEMAKNKVIALTDAGCVLDKNWLENISSPIIYNQAEVVPGKYLIKTEGLSNFATVAAYLTSNNLLNARQNYLASSRSLAITKNAWEKSGGYPDHLNTAEDLVYVNKLKHMNIKHINAPDAIVFWQPPQSVSEIFKTFFKYAYGDGLAGIASPHAYKYGYKLFLVGICLLFISFWSKFSFIFIGLLFLWFIYQTIKLNNKLDFNKRIPLIIILSGVISLFFITLAGYLFGLIKKYQNMRK